MLEWLVLFLAGQPLIDSLSVTVASDRDPLVLIFRNAQGFERYLELERGTLLPRRMWHRDSLYQNGVTTIAERALTITGRTEVNGMLLPASWRETIASNEAIVTVDSVSVNHDIPTSVFLPRVPPERR
jgi:hypothetical protein